MPAPISEAEFWSRAPKNAAGCMIWQRAVLKGPGYGHLGWRGKAWTAHRLAWTLTYGPIPEGLFVCHKCDVRTCINPEHLFLGTPDDNAKDMVVKGRTNTPAVKNRTLGNRVTARGETSGMSKLTEADVLEIRREAAERPRWGIQTELGKRFGVHSSTIAAIISRKAWQHI